MSRFSKTIAVGFLCLAGCSQCNVADRTPKAVATVVEDKEPIEIRVQDDFSAKLETAWVLDGRSTQETPVAGQVISRAVQQKREVLVVIGTKRGLPQRDEDWIEDLVKECCEASVPCRVLQGKGHVRSIAEMYDDVTALYIGQIPKRARVE